ncbi:hypothetical protein [Methylobacterium sp. ID0610]|uniref:hypothetical protein n=1 Tax=Methylobacterium carpenticola TaxID=3344827 RepID=UPI0036CC5FC8
MRAILASAVVSACMMAGPVHAQTISGRDLAGRDSAGRDLTSRDLASRDLADRERVIEKFNQDSAKQAANDAARDRRMRKIQQSICTECKPTGGPGQHRKVLVPEMPTDLAIQDPAQAPLD